MRNGFERNAARPKRLVVCTLLTASAINLAALLAAPPSWAKDDDDEPSPDSWSERISNSVKDYVGGATSHFGFGKAPAPPPSDSKAGCPTVSILPGTEVQRVSTGPTAGSAGLKYQFSLLDVGRQCSVAGSQVTIRVGADGRVLLGPAGQPGRFDVPIRVAVVSEFQQKPVESRLFRVPVSISAQQPSAPFTFTSDSLLVTIPQGHAGEYSIKVGIDAGKSADGAAKPKHAHHKKGDTADANQSASQ